MLGERVLHVRLAEGASRLAQVLRDRAQDRDLPRGETGREDESVEAVVLCLASPDLLERVLEGLTQVLDVQLRAEVMLEPEVVDPHGVPSDRPQLVWPLVADPHAHVLEQRQHVREQDRPPGADDLEGKLVDGRVERGVEAEAEVVRRCQPFDPVEVVHGLTRCEVVAVGAGERVAVALVQRERALFTGMVDERVAEIVRPCARGRGEARLDLADVVVGHRAGLGVDDVVQAGQHRFGDAGRVVGALAAERLLEDLLDLAPVLGVEPLARDEDQAGEEAAEHVATDEEPDAAALTEMEDAECDLEQLLVCDLEQLVPRVRLEDLDQRLVVMAAGQQPGAIEHALHLPAQQRDLPRARAVHGVGEETEEAAFRFHLAGLVEPLHTDIVEIGRSVDGRPRIRLGQVEQGLRAREPAHLRRQLREAERVGLLARDAEDAEAGPVHRGQHVLAALGPDLVLAVAQEGEVVVVHPLQQRTRLVELLLRDRGRRLLELGDRLVHLSAHRLPVLDRRGHVAEHALEVAAKPFERVQVGDAVDLDMDQRLRLPVLAADLEQSSIARPGGGA